MRLTAPDQEFHDGSRLLATLYAKELCLAKHNILHVRDGIQNFRYNEFAGCRRMQFG